MPPSCVRLCETGLTSCGAGLYRHAARRRGKRWVSFWRCAPNDRNRWIRKQRIHREGPPHQAPLQARLLLRGRPHAHCIWTGLCHVLVLFVAAHGMQQHGRRLPGLAVHRHGSRRVPHRGSGPRARAICAMGARHAHRLFRLRPCHRAARCVTGSMGIQPVDFRLCGGA